MGRLFSQNRILRLKYNVVNALVARFALYAFYKLYFQEGAHSIMESLFKMHVICSSCAGTLARTVQNVKPVQNSSTFHAVV